MNAKIDAEISKFTEVGMQVEKDLKNRNDECLRKTGMVENVGQYWEAKFKKRGYAMSAEKAENRAENGQDCEENPENRPR